MILGSFGKEVFVNFLVLILHPLLDVFNDLYWKELSRVLSVSAALTSLLNLPFPIQNSICAIFTTLYFCLLTAAMPETWKWRINMYSKSFCFTQIPHKEFLAQFSIFSGLLENRWGAAAATLLICNFSFLLSKQTLSYLPIPSGFTGSKPKKLVIPGFDWLMNLNVCFVMSEKIPSLEMFNFKPTSLQSLKSLL